MADAGFSALGIIFRCGWLVRNQHSVFDYIYCKDRLIDQGGKVLVDWTVKVGGAYYGGFTQTIDAVMVGKDLLVEFGLMLLVHHTSVSNEKKLILVTVLLHLYDDFCKTLEAHPEKVFEDLNVHVVVAKIEMTRKRCNISIDMFNQWKKNSK